MTYFFKSYCSSSSSSFLMSIPQSVFLDLRGLWVGTLTSSVIFGITSICQDFISLSFGRGGLFATSSCAFFDFSLRGSNYFGSSFGDSYYYCGSSLGVFFSKGVSFWCSFYVSSLRVSLTFTTFDSTHFSFSDSSSSDSSQNSSETSIFYSLI